MEKKMTVEKQITDLNAGWYNVVCSALKLDPSTFVMAQGTLGLQTSSSAGLFQMSDALPPAASVYFDAGGTSMRSSTYQLLLGALLPETGTDLQQALGDMYTNWVEYKNTWWTVKPDSELTQVELFEKWANQRLDPRKAATAINTFKQAANTLLNQALDALHAENAKQKFTASDQTLYTLYRYSATNDNAKSALNTSSSADIDYDSSTADTTLKHTTVHGAASGFYDIFSAGVSGIFDKLNTTAASSRFTVKGRIGQFATLVTEPINWFTSGEYTRAYNGKNDNTIWDPQASAGDWNSFFAQPNGSLARKVSQLILVSDYEITVTSYASYTKEEYQAISTQASFGIWPFFSGEVSATHTSQFTHHEDGTFSVTHTLNKGLIEIWGVNVLDAPK
jgi:hypothetical protein